MAFDDLPQQTDESSLPKAKASEEDLVEETLLPQLPKTFALEAEKKPEQGLSPEDKEVGKSVDSETEDAAKTEPEDLSNKVKMDDAIKRLALEKLRLEQKFAKERQAQKNDPLAKLRSKLKNSEEASLAGAGGLSSNLDAYQAKVKNHISRIWQLPEGYSFKNAELVVIIAVVLDAAGQLVDSRISAPSGDPVFDEQTLKTVQTGSPFPPPPDEQIGKTMMIRFTPKSF